jgi:hypothetical protein
MPRDESCPIGRASSVTGKPRFGMAVCHSDDNGCAFRYWFAKIRREQIIPKCRRVAFRAAAAPCATGCRRQPHRGSLSRCWAFSPRKLLNSKCARIPGVRMSPESDGPWMSMEESAGDCQKRKSAGLERQNHHGNNPSYGLNCVINFFQFVRMFPCSWLFQRIPSS